MKSNPLADYAPNFGGMPVLYGLIASFITAFVSILITTFIMGWTSVAEANLSSITYVLNMLSVLVGSLLAARQAGNRGWYYGGLTGLCYAVLITLLGLVVVSDSVFNLNTLFQNTIMALVGGFGGMIGVNLRK
ncbi:TIGR04086 family membrane protein [Tumebacillus algifaecis]|uniref:TIGR04086 family membrane protein n=1 Tax=Tumebacillus algifaecis TaxID=1214604 RepID=A0A223CZ49_9BACL|nr:TIGR04086 family membrane protein [Tumebacillus algifaecis]ASS74628.1 TIGR04086 family membrane protein [Tumebacillus algifaecis]